jgi:flagellin-like protein
MKKGISPLIATVLLIAFTVAVAGIISVWLTGFAKITTSTVGSQANIEIICNNGQISFSNLIYCSTSGYLSGDISNSGTIALGNITMQIIYTNGTQHPKLYLSLIGSSTNTSTACCGNLTISSAEKYRFNTSVSSNYDKIRVITNCTAKVTDEADSSDVTASC